MEFEKQCYAGQAVDLIDSTELQDLKENPFPGAIISPLEGNKWVLVIKPSHPAYLELFAEQIREMPHEWLIRFTQPTFPQTTREIAAREIKRRKP